MDDIIFRIEPKESPFFPMIRHNRRRLGQPKRGMRAMRRRIARAHFKVAPQRAKYHDWHLEPLS